MKKPSSDYTFAAVRRGPVVVISGTVIGPPGAEPYLVRAYEAQANVRGFRLAFRNNNAAVPFEKHEVQHLEPLIPFDVDTLKIYLPNDDVFIIESQRR